MDKFYSIIEFFSGIFAFLFLTITFLGISDYSFDKNMLSMYKENWESGPIIDITSVNQGSHCPAGYEPLISNKYPGNKEGCDCFKSESITYNKKIFTDKCSSNQLSEQCVDIDNKGNKTLTTWKGTDLCVKRMKEDFFDLMTLTGEKTCPAGKKKCGIFDSENNILCLNENQNCPINYIEIVSKNKKPSINLNDAVKKINLDDDYILYFTNTQTAKKIYVDIFANNHEICFQPNQGQLGQNFYPLSISQGESECKKKNKKTQTSLYDTRFAELDNEKSIDFYTDNELMESLSLMSDYPFPKEGTKVSLYATNYFGWKHKCFNKAKTLFTQDKLIEPETKESFDYIYVLGIISFMHLFYIIGSFVLYLMIDDSKHKSVLFLVIDLIKILLILSIFILSIISIVKTNQILKPYRAFKRMECGDEITKNALKMSYRHIIKISPLITAVSFISMIDIVIRLTYYAIFYLFLKK